MRHADLFGVPLGQVYCVCACVHVLMCVCISVCVCMHKELLGEVGLKIQGGW